MKKITPSFKKRIVATMAVSALMSGMLINASASSGLVTLSSSGYIDADDGTDVTRVFDAADLTALNTAGGALSSSVTSLNNSVSSVSSNVSTMSTQIGGMETDITSLQSQIYGTGGTPASPADGSLADKVNDLTGYGLGDATTGEILSGKKAWVNGNLVTGSMNDHHDAFTVTVGNEAGSFVHADDATKDASNNFTGVTAQIPFTGDNSGYYNGTMTLDASSIANDYYDKGQSSAAFEINPQDDASIIDWTAFHGKYPLAEGITTTTYIYMGYGRSSDPDYQAAKTAIGGGSFAQCMNMPKAVWSQLRDYDWDSVGDGTGTKYGTGNFYYTDTDRNASYAPFQNCSGDRGFYIPCVVSYDSDAGVLSITPSTIGTTHNEPEWDSYPAYTVKSYMKNDIYLIK